MKRALFWTAVIAAIAVHLAMINALPRLIMGEALARISNGHYNTWRAGDRVTPLSRTIVRPSPDLAYSACPYDLGAGPVIVQAAPWDAYWSLSLYAANSDNFFTLNDREARYGAEITLVRAGRRHPEGASMVVESPSTRGVAIVRRLAPTAATFAAAQEVAHEDLCASVRSLQPD